MKKDTLKKNPTKNEVTPKKKPVEKQNWELPQGSVYQPTGQRRPLIVFPR